MADVVGRPDEAAADLIVARTHGETAPPDRRHLQAAIASAKRRGRGYHLEADPILSTRQVHRAVSASLGAAHVHDGTGACRGVCGAAAWLSRSAGPRLTSSMSRSVWGAVVSASPHLVAGPGQGPGCRPANHLDQATIANPPGHKTARAIWASKADAESR